MAQRTPSSEDDGEDPTCWRSTNPEVAGLITLDRFGGQRMIMFLNNAEYLNITKAGKEASMARIIGALKSGASKASTEFPKHRSAAATSV